MGFWKRQRAQDVEREEDIQRARAELVSSREEHQVVLDQAPLIATLSGYLAERRERNHFGDALTASTTPRGRHA